MQTYEKKLKVGNKTETVKFRITLGGQKTLKEKYDQEILGILFMAVENAEMAADIFTEALNYRGNDNTITDGEEMYDLLVDNGVCGVGGFAEILFGIAAESGLVSKTEADTFVKKATGVMSEVLGALDNETEVKNG